MKTKKKQIMDLWKASFGDSDEFIRLYFKHVYREENSIVIEEDGRVLSSLQMLPYTMTFWGEEIPVAYISGACTLPSERGKGLMKELLLKAFDEMNRRNIAVSVLIPAEKWLFDYYRSQGYTEAFEFSVKVYTRNTCLQPEEDLIVLPRKDTPGEALFSYFDRKLRERPACILHTYDDLLTILKDLKLSEGSLFVACNRGKQPVGMAFVYASEKLKSQGSVLIKEILYDNMDVKKHLLFKITEHFKVQKALYRVPYGNNLTTFPYGMARIVNKERLVRIWTAAHPGNRMTADEMIGMDIRTLTGLLFDYPHKTAYMSLMLD